MSVTVTRDSRVTSRCPSRRDSHVTLGVTSRVSHATTTTPHHTVFVLPLVCGVSNQVQRELTYAPRLGIGAMQ